MSDKIGPMAWGSQGQVFLGEDLMHTRDYSEHTSQVIDDEVELILRAQEQRALEVLARHRGGLDAVARALLDEETIDGETVGRLVDTAYGGRSTQPGSSRCRPSSSPPARTHRVRQRRRAPGDAVDRGTAGPPASPQPAARRPDAPAPNRPRQPAGSVSNATEPAHLPAGTPRPRSGPDVPATVRPAAGRTLAAAAGAWPRSSRRGRPPACRPASR